VRAGKRKSGLRMIKLAIRPLDGIVAVPAGGREAGVRHRTLGIVVVGLVAADAGRWQRGVVVVDMAIGAGPRGYGVGSGQRERCVVVIEGRIRPLHRVMAKLASGREARVRHGTVRIVEIGLVARNAQRAAQFVVIVDVAICASPWRNRMGARQWETRARMIELAIRPLHGVMTLLAGRRETRVRYRTVRIVEIGLVARDTRGIRDAVVVVDVAVRALPWRHGVRSGQGERGLGVVERCRLPRRGVVAECASLRKSSCQVIRIRRSLKVL